MAAVTIHTTHNVRIDYETATAGIRIGAFLIDLVIVAAIYLFSVFVLESWYFELNYVVVLRLAPVFCLLGYFFLWEMWSRGQTPGKMLLRLRVIRLDGQDPTPADFLVRAVFLLPDVIFTFGMAAILFITTGKYRQRLGDIVAHTVVIHTRKTGEVSLADILTIRNRDQHRASFPAVQRMTDDDMLVVKECILRYRRYPNEANRGALSLLANRMAELLELRREDGPFSDEQFLELLLLDYIVLTR